MTDKKISTLFPPGRLGRQQSAGNLRTRHAATGRWRSERNRTQHFSVNSLTIIHRPHGRVLDKDSNGKKSCPPKD